MAARHSALTISRSRCLVLNLKVSTSIFGSRPHWNCSEWALCSRCWNTLWSRIWPNNLAGITSNPLVSRSQSTCPSAETPDHWLTINLVLTLGRNPCCNSAVDMTFVSVVPTAPFELGPVASEPMIYFVLIRDHSKSHQCRVHNFQCRTFCYRFFDEI